MKKTAIFMALATFAGASFALPGDVPPPSVGMPGSAPSLFPSEQGAFKALEVATQLVESVIVQNGCASKKFPLEVHTGSDGSGSATIGYPSSYVNLDIALDRASTANGRRYNVTGGGSLAGLAINDISGRGSYNIGSMMQELKSFWTATSPVTSTPDAFQGSIIKDYWRLSALQPIPQGFDDAGVPVSTVVDYGYQQVTKNGYIKAKYWQNSRTWRDNGVNAGTHWLKQRVAPTGNCTIEVKIAGYGQSPADNIEGFNEKGYIAVTGPSNVGPFFAKP
jgi:hypothetical protein